MPTEATDLRKLREAVRRRLFPRRHSALLAVIVAAFAVRPLIGDNGMGPILFSIAMLAILLTALYTIQVEELVGDPVALRAERRRRGIIGWILGVTATAERLAMTFAPSHKVYLAGSICWLLFFCFITWHELRSVLRQKEITGETISMSVSVYLLMGLTWGLLYAVIYELQPLAFSFPSSPAPASGLPHNEPSSIFPVLIYFSLTTLTTIGYGDIAPVSLQARYAAIAEGIAGQFYLAILVARLVGMQMSQSSSRR